MIRAARQRRPALLLQQLRSADARVTFRSYAPADILLVLMQNGGSNQSDADGGGALSLLDMCYHTIVLLNGEYEGMRAAKDNPGSFQRRLRVRFHPTPAPSKSHKRANCSLAMGYCLATRTFFCNRPPAYTVLCTCCTQRTGAISQGIAYYLDTIVGGDGLLYQPSERVATSSTQNAASGARDRASRAALTSVSTCARAPSCVLVPYKSAFELRRALTVWVNNFGAFAAALVIGSCGSIITSADPHIAAATDTWCVAHGRRLASALQNRTVHLDWAPAAPQHFASHRITSQVRANYSIAASGTATALGSPCIERQG